MHYLYATDAQNTTAGGSSYLGFLLLILFVGAFYFMFLRPQNKRRREAAEMQSKLEWGDEIQTIGGMYAVVVDTDEQAVTVEATEGVQLRFARSAIARVVSKYESETAEETEEGGTTATE